MARVPARDFEPSSIIVEFILEERERCLALAKALGNSEFLTFCIEQSYNPDELEAAHARFEQLDPFEDLM